MFVYPRTVLSIELVDTPFSMSIVVGGRVAVVRGAVPLPELRSILALGG